MLLTVPCNYRGELTINGTVHLRARDYDPVSGTFLSRDPLDGVNGTTTIANPYAYVNNDPLNRTDPTGMRPIDVSATRRSVTLSCTLWEIESMSIAERVSFVPVGVGVGLIDFDDER